MLGPAALPGTDKSGITCRWMCVMLLFAQGWCGSRPCPLLSWEHCSWFLANLHCQAASSASGLPCRSPVTGKVLETYLHPTLDWIKKCRRKINRFLMAPKPICTAELWLVTCMVMCHCCESQLSQPLIHERNALLKCKKNTVKLNWKLFLS